MCTIRTFNSIIPTLRKSYLKGREGFVIDTITTKDLEEFNLNIEICAEQLGIISKSFLNKPICIRRGKETYTVIFMVKAGYEDRLNSYKLGSLGDNITTFRVWFNKNIR